MLDDKTVIAFFKNRVRRPVSFREAASLMRLRAAEARALKKVMRRLVRSGELVRTKRGLYGPAEEMELVTGRFEAYPDGFGFVIQDKQGTRDIFVPFRATLSAMDGDRVVARVEDSKRRKGRVVRILERVHTRVVGRVELSGQVCYVKPKDRSVPFDIFVAPKNRGRARDGDRVVVEILEYSTGKRPSTGRILKMLKAPDEPKAEVEAAIEEFSLPKRFPPDVRAEAKALADKKPGRRKDLRGLNTVTIDGESAKDFDDALSIGTHEHGYTLWVHIADVGHYIGWDTLLDHESRKRGTSVYFPHRAIHMLPKELSEDLCSLRPGLKRCAFTVEMQFDRTGKRVRSEFYPSMITSNERMTYTSVRMILVDGDKKERKKYDYLLEDIDLMGELAGLLREKRLLRGSLDFDLPEPEVLLDVQGRPEAILRAERNLAHMLVEEFMISANEAVAEYLEKKGVPSLYRVHEAPDEEKVEDLLRFARPFLGRKRVTGKDVLNKLLGALKGTPVEEIITWLVLRSMKQAVYSIENVGHFGLASRCYTHFTSPIRRYPDLIVHRILREVINKKPMSEKRIEALSGVLPEIAASSSRLERIAESAERDVVNAMRMWFMKDRVGEEFEGKIIDVSSYGLRVMLKEYHVNGSVHVSSLDDDYYLFDDRTMSLRGKNTARTFTLGQELVVRVDRVDIEERRMLLGLAGVRV
jgi:ribonuclease R